MFSNWCDDFECIFFAENFPTCLQSRDGRIPASSYRWNASADELRGNRPFVQFEYLRFTRCSLQRKYFQSVAEYTYFCRPREYWISVIRNGDSTSIVVKVTQTTRKFSSALVYGWLNSLEIGELTCSSSFCVLLKIRIVCETMSQRTVI